jgi:hypothetical protein
MSPLPQQSSTDELEWLCVDIGGAGVRWVSAFSPSAEPSEAPLSASLTRERCYVQAAERQARQHPQWACHHLLTLTDLSVLPSSLPTPTLPTPTLPASSHVAPQPTLPPAPLLRVTPSGQLSCETERGEWAPGALLSELLEEVLTPPQHLGALPSASPTPRALVYLTSAGRSPFGRATLTQSLASLPVERVCTLNSATALTLGVYDQLKATPKGAPESPQRWALLDVGLTQATLSLTTLTPQTRDVEVLAQRGRVGVGAHALERRLLDDRLSCEGLVWSQLTQEARAHLAAQARERAYWATRLSWPLHLHDPSLASLTSSERGVSGRYLDELAKLARLWLEEALLEAGLLIESLHALWLTGSVGLALSKHCKRFWPHLHVRYASAQASLTGARLAVQDLLSEEPPQHQAPLSYELWLSVGSHPPERLTEPGARAPLWCERLIDATEEPLALWLCADSLPPTLWATHPAFQGAPRLLELSFEGPEAASLSWSHQDGRAVERAEGAWSLHLPHHPQTLTRP